MYIERMLRESSSFVFILAFFFLELSRFMLYQCSPSASNDAHLQVPFIRIKGLKVALQGLCLTSSLHIREQLREAEKIGVTASISSAF